MEDLSNLVFDIKEKLTDGEFKEIMEKMRDVKMNTKLTYEITYIKNKLTQDDRDGEKLEIETNIVKGYAMINESDEETFRIDIENDGATKVHFRKFYEIMGMKICDCGCGPFQGATHLRVLDDVEDDINYSQYFVQVIKIKEVK